MLKKQQKWTDNVRSRGCTMSVEARVEEKKCLKNFVQYMWLSAPFRRD